MKALHEYRKRHATPEELETVARMLAEGESLRAIGKALGCGYARTKRIAGSLEATTAAQNLRMTSMVPEMLNRLLAGMDKLVATALNIESRQTALEREMRAANKMLYSKTKTANALRERNRSLREEVRELRALMRRRGVRDGPF